LPGNAERMTPAKILIVEDDHIVARDIEQQLARIGHTVVGITTEGESAVQLVLETSPDLVLMDIRLDGEMDGIDAAQKIRETVQIPVIYLTAYADDQTLSRARLTEPFGYILKPFEDSQLRTAIEMALYKHAAERKLRESERRYAVTLSSIGDAVIATDGEARVTFMNAVAETLTGWAQAEASGRELAEVFRICNEQTGEAVENPAAKVLRSGTVVGLANHTVLHARDGRKFAIDDSGSPIIDDSGAITGVVLVFRDVTQRRLADSAEALLQANARLELALNRSNVGIWEIRKSEGEYGGARGHYSNLWEQLGYEHTDKFLDLEVSFEHVHPDDRARVENTMRAYLSGETPFLELECRIRHRDGSYHWLLGRGASERDERGVPFRFLGSSVDITDLKHAELALLESEERFRGTFDNAGVGIAHCEIDGRYLRVNQKFCDILGYSREELLKLSVTETTHPEEDMTQTEAYIAALAQRKIGSYSLDRRMLTKTGEVVWGNVTVSLQSYLSGAPEHTIAVIQDISERKRLQAELGAAKDAAEAANSAKDEFLANVSHEIRTPMNAILGLTELVLDTQLGDTQRQSLKTVNSAAQNLMAIIDDLLDFSKIEAGKVELDEADFRLRSTVAEILRALATRAHRKGLELVCTIQADVPDALIGDSGRLRQVLINLVGNAIKFTNDGEVVVSVIATPVFDGAVALRFAIRDTGIGVSPDKQATIFRAFEQADTSTTRKYGGTGLGLTIASRFVALMGGEITVTSERDRGSTFAFTAHFRVQAEPFASMNAAPPVLLRNMRVLIVDDNTVNRHILEEWLRSWQMEATSVGDGLAAMDALWHAVNSGRPYPLVLLDARMPDTDGLTLAAKIRERAELSATRIILLTSGDRPGDLERFRELRVNAHLLKPVPEGELLETIYSVMSREEWAQPAFRSQEPPFIAKVPALSSVEPQPTSLHVLVAEDNEFNAQLLKQLLLGKRHRVSLAKDGKDVLSQLAAGTFDVLLLDLHMPEADGFQVVAAIRELESNGDARLPIIALTARARKQDRQRCLAAGMDDFLAKPILADALWSAIDRVLLAPARPLIPSPGLLDPSVILAACGGDAIALEHICRALQSGLPGDVSSLKEALLARDAPLTMRAAHKLGGVLAAFSTVAAGAASEIEDHAARGELEAAQRVFARLEPMTRELLALVQRLSLDGSLLAARNEPAS
jgi:two-component system, sensor histidine kinase and response regulator